MNDELRKKILDYIVDSIGDLGTDGNVIINMVRQHIGRELLEHSLHDAVESQIIREVCKMEDK